MAEYEQVLKQIDVLSCCLVGEFAENGEYSIDSELKKNLTECTKLATSYSPELLECQAQIGDYTANFKVKFISDPENNIKVAGLFLVEKYKFMGNPYVQETFLSKYSDFDDHFFFNKFRQVFNIVTKDESEGKDIVNSIPRYEELKKEKKSLYKLIVAGLSDFNKRYVMEVLALLKSSGELGAEIREKLKIKIPKLKAEKNTPAYWAELKSELDLLLEENKEKYKEETKKLLEEINKRYASIYEKVSKEAKKQKEKKAAEKKKKKKKKEAEADDYKPYYPEVKINLKSEELKSDRFVYVEEKDKPKAKHKTKTPMHQAHQPPQHRQEQVEQEDAKGRETREQLEVDALKDIEEIKEKDMERELGI